MRQKSSRSRGENPALERVREQRAPQKGLLDQVLADALASRNGHDFSAWNNCVEVARENNNTVLQLVALQRAADLMKGERPDLNKLDIYHNKFRIPAITREYIRATAPEIAKWEALFVYRDLSFRRALGYAIGECAKQAEEISNYQMARDYWLIALVVWRDILDDPQLVTHALDIKGFNYVQQRMAFCEKCLPSPAAEVDHMPAFSPDDGLLADFRTRISKLEAYAANHTGSMTGISKDWENLAQEIQNAIKIYELSLTESVRSGLLKACIFAWTQRIELTKKYRCYAEVAYAHIALFDLTGDPNHLINVAQAKDALVNSPKAKRGDDVSAIKAWERAAGTFTNQATQVSSPEALSKAIEINQYLYGKTQSIKYLQAAETLFLSCLASMPVPQDIFYQMLYVYSELFHQADAVHKPYYHSRYMKIYQHLNPQQQLPQQQPEKVEQPRGFYCHDPYRPGGGVNVTNNAAGMFSIPPSNYQVEGIPLPEPSV